VVGGSLLAIAVSQSTMMLKLRALSRAGSLLHLFLRSGRRNEVVEDAVDGQLTQHDDLLDPQQ
jgi:hypothetical protein